jgi:mono/diheme cytochrome c family protein
VIRRNRRVLFICAATTRRERPGVRYPDRSKLSKDDSMAPFQTPRPGPGTLGAVAVAAALVARGAEAMPRLMDLYNAHPRAVTAQKDKCVLCHTNADGSGKLTAFGHKYELVGLEFTESLMKDYPNLFSAATAGASVGSAPATAGGSPAGTTTTAEAVALRANPAAATSAEKTAAADQPPAWTAQTYFRAECQNCHGKYGDGDPMGGVPAVATKSWIAERAPRDADLIKIILDGKEKMAGHRGKIDEGHARKLYDLLVEIAKKNAPTN